MQSVGVFVGGYGILPYPRHPLRGCSCPQLHQPSKQCISSHRIHRNHRIFWQRIFSHGIHRCPQIRRVWHPCHTHATLCQFSHRIHRIHRSFWRGKYSPTDFTDVHRLGGYGILPYPRHPLPILPQNSQNPQKRLSEIFSHRFHRCSQMVRLRKVLWLLWEDSLVAAWVWQGCHTHLICAHL